MTNSRRLITLRSYALAFAVVLSPGFLQVGTCERGNTELTSLELEMSGHNVDGGGAHRVFSVLPGVTAEIRGFTITGGKRNALSAL